MNMDFASLLLAAAIFLPYAIMLLAVSVIQQKDDHTHDERSLLLRGRAYRDTFFATMISGAVLAVLYGVRSVNGMAPLATTAATMFILVALSLTFLFSDFILRGVYLGRRESEQSYLGQSISMLAIFIVNVMAFLSMADEWEGVRLPLTMGSEVMMLVCMVWCLSFSVAGFIRYGQYKKELKEERT